MGRVPKPFSAPLLDTRSCQKTWELRHCMPIMASRQNVLRVRDQASLSRKQYPQGFIMYTDGSVTKDQSGWGFTAKQGATTIHEDNESYMVSASSLTIEVVAHCPRKQQSHHIIMSSSTQIQRACWKKVKTWISRTGWRICQCHPLNLLWMYCPWYTGVKGNKRADRLEGKATITNGVRLGRSDVLRSLRHYLRAQSQGRHTIWKRSMIFLESQRKAVGRTMALF